MENISKKELKRAVDQKFDEEILEIQDVSGAAHATFKVKLENVGEIIASFCYKDRDEHRFEIVGPAMRKVKEETDLPIAELYHFDISKEIIPYMFYLSEKLEGENVEWWAERGPNFQYFSEQRKRNLLFDAGQKMARLHSQIKFDDFGHLVYNDGLELDPRESWPALLRDILEKEQFPEMSKPFEDLIPGMRTFLEDYSGEMITGDGAVMVHQDYSWDNLLVKGSEISGVIDWERAVAAHPELDFFTAEHRLVNFQTEKSIRKYRNSFADGYRSIRNLQKGWRNRRKFYYVLKDIEAMWTYSGWSKKIPEEDREEKKRELRNRYEKNKAEVERIFD